MKRIRVIPVLLISDGGLVKSIKFGNFKYVGDPINAVRIFNEKEVDEIVILDISASLNRRPPDFSMIKEIVSEAFMPVAYGGGITNVSEIKELINSGIEKVVINSSAFRSPNLVTEASSVFGNQSIVVSIDVKKNIFGRQYVHILNGTKNTGLDPLEYSLTMQSAGAGELFLNSIDRDGTFNGYDLKLIEAVSNKLSIPVVALGGAGNVSDFREAVKVGASAVAAGSLFVFQRPHRAVLISYPCQDELRENVYSLIN